MTKGKDKSIDINFSVPFVHRLRVTNEVAEDGFSQLLGVLDGGEAGPPKVLIVCESPVATASNRLKKLHEKLSAANSVNVVASPFLIDGGESIKNSTAAAKQILSHINKHDLDRRSYIIAIGGGAMLDAVGYAAAVAHRGIRLVRLPTTTLAQADSGVGVKNAINNFDKKNWIGTFAVPWAVINDAGLLTTLSDRDYCSGFGESVRQCR